MKGFKFKILLIISGMLISFGSCNELFKKSGKGKSSAEKQSDIKIVKEYFANHQLKSEISVRGKMREGITKNYNKSGNLISEVNYSNNKLDGLSTNYYASGKVHSTIMYKNGVKNGETVWYYESGKVFRVTPFTDGEINGIQKFYFEDGKPMAEVPYKNGQPGIGTKEYSKEGNLITKYPTIKFDEINHILVEDKLILKVRLSNNSYRVEFFKGNLADGKYLSDNLTEIPDNRGVCTFEYYVPSGYVKNEKLNFVVKYKTDYDLPYIMQKSYNLVLQH